MKRRNAECGKMRRPVKRNKITDGIYGSTLLYLKFFSLWAVVIMADFILEFRFEFLWPFWMLLRSVYDSFKYQGLAFSVFFVCIALTSDMICFFFIPVQWVFFAASTYVWVQYVWHADKGICLPTVILCSVFVYVEGGVRLRDLRHMPAHVDLCRPFAAHCIGYPVVTLGFGLKSYVCHRIRVRRQKQVAKENNFYMQLLHEALPVSAQAQSVLKDGHGAEKSTGTSSNCTSGTLAIEKGPDNTSSLVNVSASQYVPEKQHHMNGSAINHLNSNLNHSSSNVNGSTSASSSINSNKTNHSKKSDASNRNVSDKNASTVSCNNVVASNNCNNNHVISSTAGGAGAGDSCPPISDSNVVSSQVSSNNSFSCVGGKASHSVCSLYVASSQASSATKQHAHTNGVLAHSSGVTLADGPNSAQQTDFEAPPPEKTCKGSKSKHDKKENANLQKEEGRKKNKNRDKESNREATNKDKDKETTREKDKEAKEASNVHKEKDAGSSGMKEFQKEKDVVKEKDVEAIYREKESKKDRDREREREELQQKHLEHKENCERQIRQLRAEITQLRSQNEQLNVRVNAARTAERAAISSAERRVSEERRRAEGCRQRRVALEAEVASLRQQLLQTRERGQRLERDLQNAERQVSTLENQMRENGPDAWRTAFNTLRDRAQQLERSLSAETRIKMDLFSAVGEAKRLSGLREGVIRNQEKEIEELKSKIAQMLAVMPSDPFPQSSYHMQMSHPHQLSQPSPSSTNPLSNLDPNATVYTPKSVNPTTIKG